MTLHLLTFGTGTTGIACDRPILSGWRRFADANLINPDGDIQTLRVGT